MFHAYGSSQADDRTEVLRALFAPPYLHSYPFVEVPLNTHLFHVDFAPVSEDSRWQRLIFDNVDNLFALGPAKDLSISRVHVQSVRKCGLDYEMRRVVKIYEGNTINGHSVYVSVCTDGSVVIGGVETLVWSDIVNMLDIWEEPLLDK